MCVTKDQSRARIQSESVTRRILECFQFHSFKQHGFDGMTVADHVGEFVRVLVQLALQPPVAFW